MCHPPSLLLLLLRNRQLARAFAEPPVFPKKLREIKRREIKLREVDKEIFFLFFFFLFFPRWRFPSRSGIGTRGNCRESPKAKSLATLDDGPSILQFPVCHSMQRRCTYLAIAGISYKLANFTRRRDITQYRGVQGNRCISKPSVQVYSNTHCNITTCRHTLLSVSVSPHVRHYTPTPFT